MAYWNLYNDLSRTHIKIDKSPFRVGRGPDQDVVCRSNKVSRNHAVFITKPDCTLYVQDNKSTNGTYVNRKQIDDKVPFQLHNNDEVGLGVHSEMWGDIINPDVDYLSVYTVQWCMSPIVISDDEKDVSTDMLYHILTKACDNSNSSSEVETNKKNDIHQQNNEMDSDNLPKNQVPDDTGFNRNCNKIDEEKVEAFKPDDENKEEINRDLARNEIISNSRINRIEQEHPYKTPTRNHSDTHEIVRNLAKCSQWFNPTSPKFFISVISFDKDPILPKSNQNSSDNCNTINKTNDIVPDNNNTKSNTPASDDVASDAEKSLNMQDENN